MGKYLQAPVDWCRRQKHLVQLKEIHHPPVFVVTMALLKDEEIDQSRTDERDCSGFGLPRQGLQ